ncbi:MAG: hypothetical protein ABW199_06915, partial [Caulobacterales bacterium]
MPKITRRGLAGLGAGALAAPLLAPRAHAMAPVWVNERRIIRIDVGLRPYRRSGFRVERQALGQK